MTRASDVRQRNPFHGPIVTETIEDPDHYREVFSHKILVSETLDVFRRVNVAVLGAQGSGKSMILNLIRQPVMQAWLDKQGRPPEPLRGVDPFFGISINLTRAGLQVFGRRSFNVGLADSRHSWGPELAGAADYLTHYLLREFARALAFLTQPEGHLLAQWMELNPEHIGSLAWREIASWDLWNGVYASCQSLGDVAEKATDRFNAWKGFLNYRQDLLPDELRRALVSPEDALHSCGNLLQRLSSCATGLPLFVVIDQYEELPRLNPALGPGMQRLVNTLMKSRDPVVFIKVGVRTNDWGQETRVWGSESAIELQRDYVSIDLSELLMRKENSQGWLFPSFARDVAYRRLRYEGRYRKARLDTLPVMLGEWTADHEATLYSGLKPRPKLLLRGLPEEVKRSLLQIPEVFESNLELRLAGAWATQQLRREREAGDVMHLGVSERPWDKEWWRKERVDIALLQIASLYNQKRLYYGWETMLYLAGGNITAFLLLCEEIWDIASKLGEDPLSGVALKPNVQSAGAYAASLRWRTRDKNGLDQGARRYIVLTNLGAAIRSAVIDDMGISNPGHSGFSVSESDLYAEGATDARRFLQNAVNWAVMEERRHVSKEDRSTARLKYYLHPLLAPSLGIPYKRVKEPRYVEAEDVVGWVSLAAKPELRSRFRRSSQAAEPSPDDSQQRLFEE